MKQPRKRFLAFVPAGIIVGVVTAAAAGISVIPAATAADVVVTGSVNATIDTPADPPAGQDGTGGTCNSDSPSGGDASFDIASGWETSAVVTGTCTINFGASNGQIQLTFENKNAGSYFYCNHPGGGARSCAAPADRVGNVPANGAIDATGGPDDRFGIALHSVPLNAAAGTGFTADNSPQATESIWRPIPDNGSPAQLCLSSAAGAASCTFVFGVEGKGSAPTQNNGNYDGTLLLTAAQL